MRFRSTLILFLIAATAFAYFLFVDQPRHLREPHPGREGQNLCALDAAAIVHVRIVRGDTVITLQRQGEDWVVTSPVSDHAEAVTTNVLLHTIGTAAIERILPASSESLSTYGLDPSQVEVLCSTAGSGRLLLRVGDFNPDRSACYVLRDEGTDVLMVTAGLKRSVEKPLFDFRDKRVATFDLGGVESFTVSAQSELTWHFREPGRWFTIIGTDTLRGDATAVETILRELRAMRALRIVDAPASHQLPGRTVGAVTVHLSPDSTVVFTFGDERDGECAVAVGGVARTVYVASDVLGVFRRSLTDLRFRNLLDFDGTEVTRITLETSAYTTSIFRTGEVWSFANPELGTLSPDDMAVLIQTLRGLKFREIVEEDFPTPLRGALAKPVFRIELFGSSGVTIDAMDAGEVIPVRHMCYATSRSSRHLGLIDTEPLREVERIFESFRVR